MKKKALALLLLTLAFGQEIEHSLSASIRGRSSVFKVSNERNTLGELRSRFGLLIKAENDVSAFLQIQDSRNFGSEASTLSNSANIDLHQAYFSLDKFLNSRLNFSFGRKEMAFDNQRIVGTVGWHNVGRSFDGIFLKSEHANSSFNIFLTTVKETASPRDSANVYFSGFHGSVNIFKEWQASAYFYSQDITESSNHLKTLGLFSRFSNDQISAELQIAKQFGDASAAASYDALYLSAMASLPISKDFKVTAMFEKLSGDDGKSADIQSFQPLYGTNHKFNGFFDKFFVGPAKLPNNGLIDYKIAMQLWKKLSIATHFFYNDEAYTALGSTRASEDFLGNEVDLTYNYAYSKQVSFTFGFSYFVFGDDYIVSDNKSDIMAYLMMSFKI